MAMRIRLRLEGLLRCWYLVPPGVGCIEDICNDIVAAFQLQETCPNGVSLFMDGFALPPKQPTLLVNDKDIVSVHPKDICEDVEAKTSRQGPHVRTSTSEGDSHGHSASNSSLKDCQKIKRKHNGLLDEVNYHDQLKTKKRKERNNDATEQQIKSVACGRIYQDLNHVSTIDSLTESSTITDSGQSTKANDPEFECAKEVDKMSATHMAGKPLLCKSTIKRALHIPKSPWMSFALLFTILSRQLPCTDIGLLRQHYAGFKQGRVSREHLLKKLKEVVGEKTLLEAITSMQSQAPFMGMLQPLRCFIEHAADDEGRHSPLELKGMYRTENSSIMPTS